jgi:hypothetical protein
MERPLPESAVSPAGRPRPFDKEGSRQEASEAVTLLRRLPLHMAE